MVGKSRVSKLAVGALLACQIGSINTTVSGGLFSGIIGSIKEYVSVPLTVFQTNPAAGLPLLYRIPDFASYLYSWLVKIGAFFVDAFTESGEFYDEITIKRELKKIFAGSGVSAKKFGKFYVDLLRAFKGVARRKEIIKSDGNGSEETNFVLISGVKSPLRRRLVQDVCNSIYSKDPFFIDLTKYEDKSLSSIIDTLFSTPERQPSWMRSYSNEEEDVDTSRKGIVEYLNNKNSQGVVRILVTPRLLRTLDPLFSALVDPEAKGKITFRGKNIRLDSVTVVLELKEDDVGSDLEFLGRSQHVKFPKEIERVELGDLVYNVFYRSFDYYKEAFGFNASCFGEKSKKCYRAKDERFRKRFYDFFR